MKASVFQPSSREPAGEPKRRHLRVVHHKTQLGEAGRSSRPPRWIVLTVAIAVAAAMIAAGSTYLWQRGSADEVPATTAQTVADAAAQQQAAAALAVTTEQLAAAELRVSALEARLNRVGGALGASRGREAASGGSIATLTATNQALEQRLQSAFAARRDAFAAAAVLTGTPLADGIYLTTLKAVGGRQTPPFAVLHVRGNPEWKVLAIVKSANVRVLGPYGLRQISLTQLNEMFAPGSPRAEEMAASDFRVAVKGNRITGITQLQ